MQTNAFNYTRTVFNIRLDSVFLLYCKSNIIQIMFLQFVLHIPIGMSFGINYLGVLKKLLHKQDYIQ